MAKIDVLRKEDIQGAAQLQLDMALETEGLKLDLQMIRRGVCILADSPQLGTFFVVRGQDNVPHSSLMVTKAFYPGIGEEWWVQSVFVSAALRRQGIFKDMVLKVFEQAKKNTISRVSLYVEHDNELAKNIYKKFGFKQSSLSFIGVDLVYSQKTVQFGGPAIALQPDLLLEGFPHRFDVIKEGTKEGFINVFYEYSDWRAGLILYLHTVQLPVSLFSAFVRQLSTLKLGKLGLPVTAIRRLSQKEDMQDWLQAGMSKTGYLLYTADLINQ